MSHPVVGDPEMAVVACTTIGSSALRDDDGRGRGWTMALHRARVDPVNVAAPPAAADPGGPRPQRKDATQLMSRSVDARSPRVCAVGGRG
jgi:hypothetical protein